MHAGRDQQIPRPAHIAVFKRDFKDSIHLPRIFNGCVRYLDAVMPDLLKRQSQELVSERCRLA